jgi:hypothetical protein
MRSSFPTAAKMTLTGISIAFISVVESFPKNILSVGRQMKAHAVRQLPIAMIRHRALPILLDNHDRIGCTKTIRDVAYVRRDIN